jgi:hypothetical protein
MAFPALAITNGSPLAAWSTRRGLVDIDRLHGFIK